MFILLVLGVLAREKKSLVEKNNDIEADAELSSLMKEWEEYMKDFEPADMLTFVVGARATQEFFEEITVVPSVVRGGWFLTGSEERDIEVVVIDPLGEQIHEKTKSREGIIYFQATRRGTYTFKFTNTKVFKENYITFALHCGNSTSEVLQAEHLHPHEQSLLQLQKEIKDFQIDNKFAQLRQESHYITVANANQNLFWFTMLECAAVMGLTFWQVFYIKKLLDNRRVL